MSAPEQKRRIRLTPVSTLHYVRLIYRSVLFVALAVSYLLFRLNRGEPLSTQLERQPVILIVIWVVFVIEMILRFFPSRLESPGCQKQFYRNYRKSGQTEIMIQDNNSVMLIALVWVVFNAVFGALYMAGVFDDGIMFLLCGAYSVSDMICILFFCPFQSWFMKNKCCSVCRIYNWDYAMMFTPLFFVRGPYTWSLLGLSVALLVRWEITFFRHPERFSDHTNDYLKCANCTEKLCVHKKQLRRLWRDIEAYTAERIRRLKK